MCIAIKSVNILLHSKATRGSDTSYLVCTEDNEPTCLDPFSTYLGKLSLREDKYFQYPSNKIRPW